MKKYNSQKTIYNKKSLKRRNKISNKLRFTMFCTVCVISAVLLFGMLESVSASKYRETFVLTVSTGDTLWDIAKENNPLNKDIRSVIDDIIRINKLTSSDLCAGDKLTIPVY